MYGELHFGIVDLSKNHWTKERFQEVLELKMYDMIKKEPIPQDPMFLLFADGVVYRYVHEIKCKEI